MKFQSFNDRQFKKTFVNITNRIRINTISLLITHQRSSALLCPLLLLVIVPSNGNRGSLNDLELDPVPYPELLLDRGGLNDRSYRR